MIITINIMTAAVHATYFCPGDGDVRSFAGDAGGPTGVFDRGPGAIDVGRIRGARLAAGSGAGFAFGAGVRAIRAGIMTFSRAVNSGSR